MTLNPNAIEDVRTKHLRLVLILLLLTQLCSLAIAMRLGSPYLLAEVIIFSIGLSVVVGFKIAAQKTGARRRGGTGL